MYSKTPRQTRESRPGLYTGPAPEYSSRPDPSGLPPQTPNFNNGWRSSATNSGVSGASGRPRSLAEELEKIEQSITLTLQEIDRNFSKAHKIVVDSILPVIERYGQESQNLRTGSLFWKQFLETSANVSLSGYEELADPLEDDELPESTTTTTTKPMNAVGMDSIAESTSLTSGLATETYSEINPETPPTHGSSTPINTRHSFSTPRTDRSGSKSSPSRIPRPISTEKLKTHGLPEGSIPQDPVSWTRFNDPYDGDMKNRLKEKALRYSQEYLSTNQLSTFSTPNRAHSNADKVIDSPMDLDTPPAGILLHRVFDKNWKIQATPNKSTKLPTSVSRLRGQIVENKTPRTKLSSTLFNQNFSSSPSDSLEPPKLQSELPSSSPPDSSNSQFLPSLTSIQTQKYAPTTPQRNSKYNIYDSDLDSDIIMPDGLSSPVTMNFSVPQERLLRTPARQAAQTIVDDILRTVGGVGQSSSILSQGSPDYNLSLDPDSSI